MTTPKIETQTKKTPSINTLEELKTELEKRKNTDTNEIEKTKIQTILDKLTPFLTDKETQDTEKWKNFFLKLSPDEQGLILEVKTLSENIKLNLSTLRQELPRIAKDSLVTNWEKPDSLKVIPNNTKQKSLQIPTDPLENIVKTTAVGWAIWEVAKEIKNDFGGEWKSKWLLKELLSPLLNWAKEIANTSKPTEVWDIWGRLEYFLWKFFHIFLKDSFWIDLKKNWDQSAEKPTGDEEAKKIEVKDFEKNELLMKKTWNFLIQKSKEKKTNGNPFSEAYTEFKEKEKIDEEKQIDNFAAEFFSFPKIKTQSFNFLKQKNIDVSNLVDNYKNNEEKNKKAFSIFQLSLINNEKWIDGKIGKQIPDWREKPLSEWVVKLWELTGMEKIQKIRDYLKEKEITNINDLKKINFEDLFLKNDEGWNMSGIVLEEAEKIMAEFWINKGIAKELIKELFVLGNWKQDIKTFRTIIKTKYQDEKLLSFIDKVIGNEKWDVEWYQKTVFDFMDKFWLWEYKKVFWWNWEKLETKDIFSFFFLTKWEKNIDNLTEWTRVLLYIFLFKTILKKDSWEASANLIEYLKNNVGKNKYIQEISDNLSTILISWVEKGTLIALVWGEQVFNFIINLSKNNPEIAGIAFVAAILAIMYARPLVIGMMGLQLFLQLFWAWLSADVILKSFWGTSWENPNSPKK